MNRLIAKYRSWRAYRETYDQLMGLSPRQLADLGIPRGSIKQVARSADVGADHQF